MKQVLRASLIGTKPPFASSTQQLGNKIQKPQSQNSNLILKIKRATTKITTEKKSKSKGKKIRNKVLTFLSHEPFFPILICFSSFSFCYSA